MATSVDYNEIVPDTGGKSRGELLEEALEALRAALPPGVINNTGLAGAIGIALQDERKADREARLQAHRDALRGPPGGGGRP